MNGVFCSQITGTIYGTDAAYVGNGNQTCFAGNPPMSNKTLIDNAILDIGTAYNEAFGRTNPTATELGAGNIGGLTLAPGLYKWSSSVIIPSDLTLSGSATDVWIFQIAGNLDIASGGSVPSGVKVNLSGGALASNVFWQVGGGTGATLGTYSTFNGNILTAKQIIIQTGAVLNGRAFAQTQVTLDASVITNPSGSTGTSTGTTTSTSSDLSLLIAAKASAQALITASGTESTTPGDHIVGSLATLIAAEAAANGTSTDSQSVIDAQVITLNAAIAAYNAAIVGSPMVSHNPTTLAATSISDVSATIGGQNGDTDALGRSFWASLAPFVTTSSTLPAGVYSTPDIGPILANYWYYGAFAATGIPSITASTTYYFNTWTNIGGTWYPGDVLSFTTATALLPVPILSNFTISDGTLTPVFASGVNTYADSVASTTSSITITPTTSEAGATITVNGATVASGSASPPISLSIGAGNMVFIAITASDAVTTNTYVINVTRNQ